jgi:hypothetical protein
MGRPDGVCRFDPGRQRAGNERYRQPEEHGDGSGRFEVSQDWGIHPHRRHTFCKDVTREKAPGTFSTPSGNDRWPDFLSYRLHAIYGDKVSLVNESITGNAVVAGNAIGEPAVKRLERDVLGVSGVTTVILMEGCNDLGSARNKPEPVIEGYKQINDRLHAAGLSVVAATLTPCFPPLQARCARNLCLIARVALATICIRTDAAIRRWAKPSTPLSSLPARKPNNGAIAPRRQFSRGQASGPLGGQVLGGSLN